MPDCDYCGDSFDDESAYLKHLKAEHRSELGPIDRRRIGDVDIDDGGLPTGPIALAVVIVASVAIVGYVVFIAGSGGAAAGEPTYDASNHVHGTMTMTIDGEEVDFMEPQFVENHQVFHFHGYENDEYGEHVWHIHGHGVTLQWALDSLGIEVNDEGTVLTFDGETYDDSDPGTTVEVTVNGEAVDIPTYELDGVGPEDQAAAGAGDDVVITVETDE